MPVSADVLRTHLAYTAWASRRLIDASAQLTSAELDRDFETSDRSVLGTLVHLFRADRVWLQRVTKHPKPFFMGEGEHSLAVLQNDWPPVLQQWQDWGDGLTAASVQDMLTYQDLKGRSWSQPLWQVVLHVVNHGTHHRGQVSGFLRSLGRTPPPLDLSFYYREVA
jgi:uncharacterized damage-inducible protein DinB